MRINKIKKKLKNGEPVFGTMIKEAKSINISELLEIAGFDYFVIDMEHASYDMSDIAGILQYARKTEVTGVVRIPRLDYAYVAKALDMGAEGIWVPHLDTPEEAKDLVRFGKYPPEGIRGAAIPKHFISSIEAGIREAMEGGVLGGYPLIDLKATLYDGSYHEVDSSELAFKIAGSMALKEALAKGKPALLEPIMKLVVVTPQEFVGDIIADLNSRRGQIEAIERQGDTTAVHCYVPLSETFGYTTIIRSLTQGRATQTMEFYRYQEMPAEMTEEIRITGKRNA